MRTAHSFVRGEDKSNAFSMSLLQYSGCGELLSACLSSKVEIIVFSSSLACWIAKLWRVRKRGCHELSRSFSKQFRIFYFILYPGLFYSMSNTFLHIDLWVGTIANKSQHNFDIRSVSATLDAVI